MGDHSTPDITDRPRPVLDAAKRTGTALAAGAAVVTALVAFGTITLAQGDAITGLLGLIPGVVAGVGAVVSSFKTATAAEPAVTPVSSPMAEVNGDLVPLVALGSVS